MIHPTEALQKLNSSDGRDATNKLDFSTLYDRYAPALLGVITQIVSDKVEAVKLLEATFVKIQSELAQFHSGSQPLFAWLLATARCTALEALQSRKYVPTPIFQLTTTGQVVGSLTSVVTLPTDFRTDATDPRLKQLLDSVLFKNCTPEEAATAVGLPVETARQQLRLAMQQLRSQKGK